MAGSGIVKLNKEVTGNKIEYNMAGSGQIIANKMNVTKVECSLASSGSIHIAGKADRAEYNVAASGSINAYDCEVRNVDCNIAASGKIEARASGSLKANIVGSGEILYKGNPTVDKSIMGSGSVRKVN